MPRSLDRTLTVRDLILLAFGSAVGSGIFLTPAAVLRQSGSVGAAMFVWVLGGVLSVLGALTYAEMGARDPEAGGIYVYIRDAFGPFFAFLYGWTLFFVIASGTFATLAAAFTTYLAPLFSFSPIAGKALQLMFIAVVAGLNVIGTRDAANAQNWMAVFKGGVIVFLGVLLVAVGHGFSSGVQIVPEHFTPRLFSNVGLAMISVLWAYEGWQWVTFSAEEVVEPQRNFPRGFVIGTIVLVAIYVIANLGYVAALGQAAPNDDSIAAAAVRATLGPWAAKVVTVTVLVSIFSAAVTVPLTAARVFFAMARDGVFFQKLAEVHPRFRTPAASVISLSVVSLLLAWSGTFGQLLEYVVFVGWIFYALGALAIFTYRRRDPHGARPFRVPGYPLTPLLFVGSAAAIVINTVVEHPLNSAVGLVVVLIGAPAYVVWRASSRSKRPPLRAIPGSAEPRPPRITNPPN